MEGAGERGNGDDPVVEREFPWERYARDDWALMMACGECGAPPEVGCVGRPIDWPHEARQLAVVAAARKALGE